MSKIITMDGPRLNTPNLNGRVYPQNDFEVGLRAYYKTIDAGRAYGELGHPESGVVTPHNCSHIVRDVRIVKARLPRKKKKAMKKEGTYSLWRYLNIKTEVDIEILKSDMGKIVEPIIDSTFMSMRSTGHVTGNKVSQLTILSFDLIPKI